MTLGRYDLVIFDCDGVLIDSEPIANRVLVEQLRAIGLDLPAEEVMRAYIGNTRDGCIAITERMLGRPLPGDFAAQGLEAAGALCFRSMAELPALLY